MFNLTKNIFGKKDFSALIEKVNSLEPELEKLTDEDLKGRSDYLKKKVQETENPDEFLTEAFALVREAAKRTLNQRHFDVQLIGGIVLHEGKISEMATGEGKTLAATSPAYFNARTGKGVHVITVNDYLATRDAVWMGQIYDLLGLSVACLTHDGAYLYDPHWHIPEDKEALVDKERDTSGSFLVQREYLKPISRREAYESDILYGTNHEFGFDYLRDNLAYSLEQQVQLRRPIGVEVPTEASGVQKGHYYAIIDEVDSILIDEARTPLIIAAPDAESSEYYRLFSQIAKNLNKDDDYLVDEKAKSVTITEVGIDKVEKILKIDNFYAPENFRLVHYLEESLRARALFNLDKQYIVRDGNVVIVDEFTGRLMYGRRYSGGLHQAIEAKEGVKVQQESRTFAQITIQNYFRLYEKIAGMTGTAQTSAEEFHKVYNLEVVSIPTNKPLIRKDNSDLIYKNLKAKYEAVIKEIEERHKAGQPILVGTTSIDNNELASSLLKRAGINHEILNAKNHEREGAIIAQAGREGAVTVATNMAGRGVDIILGGNPPDVFEAQKVKDLGGLHIIGTERHEARRIDNQLRGRAGRQGDPGSSRFFLSLEDDLMRIFGGDRIKSLMERFNFPDDQPIESGMVSKIVNEAQKKVEGLNFDARKHLLEFDDVLNKQRTAVYNKRQDILQGITDGKIEELVKEIMPDFNASKYENLEMPALGVRILGILDMLWMDHLDNMEALRESVQIRAYGQHDPLVEYRREGHRLYSDLFVNFENYIKENIEKIVEVSREELMRPTASTPQSVNSQFSKVGRNDPCPCGSGKKYKKCHGK